MSRGTLAVNTERAYSALGHTAAIVDETKAELVTATCGRLSFRSQREVIAKLYHATVDLKTHFPSFKVPPTACLSSHLAKITLSAGSREATTSRKVSYAEASSPARSLPERAFHDRKITPGRFEHNARVQTV